MKVGEGKPINAMLPIALNIAHKSFLNMTLALQSHTQYSTSDPHILDLQTLLLFLILCFEIYHTLHLEPSYFSKASYCSKPLTHSLSH